MLWSRELCTRLPNSLVEGDAFHEHQLMLESEIPATFLGFFKFIYCKFHNLVGLDLSKASLVLLFWVKVLK